MIAEDKLSELELNLLDKNMKTTVLNQELDSAKRKIEEMTVQMKYIEIENHDLKQEVRDLFDKVRCSYSMLSKN